MALIDTARLKSASVNLTSDASALPEAARLVAFAELAYKAALAGRDVGLRLGLFHLANDGLSSVVHIDMLDADVLLAAVSQTSKDLNLRCKSPHQSGRR